MVSITTLLVLFFLAVPAASSLAVTWQVPEDFTSVGEALEAAVDGDIILVAAGTYPGPFSFSKDITIIGNPAAPETVVLEVASFFVAGPTLARCEGLAFSGVNLESTAAIAQTARFLDCRFENFHFVNSWGIAVMFADVEFQRCLVRDNHNEASMFWIMNSTRAVFRDCRFLDNSGGVSGVITQVHSTPLLLEDCLFQGNHSTGSGGAIHGASGVTIENCRFEGNSAASHGGAIYGDGNDDCTIDDSTFVGNSAAQGGALATGQVFRFNLVNIDFSQNTASVAGPQGFTMVGGQVDMTCCQADLQLWEGIGTVTLDNSGCTVGTETLTWDGLKACYR